MNPGSPSSFTDIYIYTTILPLWCADGRYFYYISGTPAETDALQNYNN